MPHFSLNKLKAMAGALLLSLPTIASAQQKEVVAPSFAQPPVIDGRLDDAAWQSGIWYSNFATNEATPAPAADKTEFKIGHDAQSLYIGVRLHVPAGYTPRATVTDRDGPMWRDDSLEVMLHVTPTTDEYIHWIINPAGHFYDALRVQGGSLADISFNSSIKVATHIADDAWYAEIAIPLADLGLTDKTPRTWAINIGRSSRSSGKMQFSSFARISGDAHQPKLFVPLQIPTLDTTAFQWVLDWQPTIHMTRSESGNAFSTQMMIHNRTPWYDFVELHFRVLSQGQETSSYRTKRGLDAGASRLHEFVIPFTQAGEAVVELELTNLRTGQTVARRMRGVKLDDASMEMQLTSPSYRNTIFATQNLTELTGNVRLNLAAEQLANTSLVVSLRDDKGKVHATQTIAITDNLVKMNLPLSGELPQGQYTLEAAMHNQAGQALHQTSQTIHKLPPAPQGGREVRINDQGIVCVDGKPFLPYGAMMIRPHDDLNTVASQGYTAVFEYSFYWMKPEQQRQWLDRVHAQGLMAIIYPYPEPPMARDKALTVPLSNEDAAKIREFVRTWKSHPAILAWYLADEPELHGTLPARLRAIHAICQEEDPYHPTIVLNNTFNGMEVYTDCGDIRMPNPFPGFYKDSGPRRRLNYAHQLVHHAAVQTDMMRATWTTPQAFSWADLRENRSDERPPSFAEMRSMNYQAAIAGATGWVWYSYQHGRRHPSIRLSLGYLAKEAALLKEPLLALDTARKLPITPKDERLVHSLRTTKEGLFLFVANTSEDAINIQIELPKNAPAKWHVVSEKRNVTASPSGVLTDTIQPYATHIYTTNAAVAGKLDLAAMQKWIDAAPTLSKELDPLPEQEQQKWSSVVSR